MLQSWVETCETETNQGSDYSIIFAGLTDLQENRIVRCAHHRVRLLRAISEFYLMQSNTNVYTDVKKYIKYTKYTSMVIIGWRREMGMGTRNRGESIIIRGLIGPLIIACYEIGRG